MKNKITVSIAGQEYTMVAAEGEDYKNGLPVEMLADFKANMEKILGAGRCHVLNIRPEGGAVL